MTHVRSHRRRDPRTGKRVNVRAHHRDGISLPDAAGQQASFLDLLDDDTRARINAAVGSGKPGPVNKTPGGRSARSAVGNTRNAGGDPLDFSSPIRATVRVPRIGTVGQGWWTVTASLYSTILTGASPVAAVTSRARGGEIAPGGRTPPPSSTVTRKGGQMAWVVAA